MKSRGDKSEPVIIKRKGRKHDHEPHGGAWKVAFADFTLAMMALFMVLWVIQPLRQMELSDATMLANPMVDGAAGIFDGSSSTPLDFGGIKVTPVPERNAKDSQAVEAGKEASEPRKRYSQAQDMHELVELMQKLAIEIDAKTNLEVEIVPQGLRVLIKDDQQRDMFARGSASMQPHFKQLLERLAQVLAKVDNKLIVSGHTDATPYRNAQGYDNWNLSGDRALSARQVLINAGLPKDALLQVSAQADVMPLVADKPEDGANRRIELLLLSDRAEQLYRALFGGQGAQATVSESGASLTPASVTPAAPSSRDVAQQPSAL